MAYMSMRIHAIILNTPLLDAAASRAYNQKEEVERVREEHISMRRLAEFSLLAGDLYAESMNVARMREGALNHKALQEQYEGDMRAEVPLEIKLRTNTCDLTVSGRADGLMLEDGRVLIEEIKSAQGRVQPDSYPVHWAQAKGYAYMACVKHARERAAVRLVYVHSLAGGATTRFTREFTLAELERDFDALVKPYAAWLDAQVRFQDARDASIAEMEFPFGGYRAGQRRMAVRSYRALRDGYGLLIQAPTGTGKTAGALFPALKALGDGHVSKVMYLTARRTTRRAAWDCLKLLKQRGLRARVCVLNAKEQICPTPGVRCTPQTCPYCVGYFDKRRGALDDAMDMTDYDFDSIRALAENHGVCPFELSLELCETADVIICDYNYVFDPNVYLRRFFTTKSSFALLIDEAHNLESRARDMLSCAIRFDDYVTLYRHISAQLGRESAECVELIKFMTKWRAFGVGREQPGFDKVKPDALIRACEEFTDATSPSLSAAADCAGEWAERWFDLMSFARVGAMYAQENYATLYEPRGANAVDVTQLCVDATAHIRKCLDKARASVLFSATLTPIKHYFSALGLEDDKGDAMLELPSPFLSENFLIRRMPISTRYSQRGESLAPIAHALGAMARAHTGNYIACFPSYEYLRAASETFRRICPDIDMIRQHPSMNDRQRDAFLARFQPAPAKSMVAFIAMGGVFSEGIDLPGDRLSGAAIVGVGMPQLCAEREALRDHFECKLGEGFNYAYVYPGICKVLQAAGRVIRTEDDVGVALLMDDRFFREPYSELFPRHWNVGDALPDELDELLRRFWRGESC